MTSTPATTVAPTTALLDDSAPTAPGDRIGLDDIAFPHPSIRLRQDEEWALVRVGDEWRQIRLHDYNDVFAVPGLYDMWVYDLLKCASPRRVRDLLNRCLRESGTDPESLTLLDLGAGNGCVAAEFATLGVHHCVGVDIAPTARVAAERDRPGLYDDYVIADLTALDPDDDRRLERHRFTALSCVAALGFGDIPPAVLDAALARLEPGAWVAVTLKNEYVADPTASPFATLLNEHERRGSLRVVAQESYVHRVDAAGTPIRYTAIIARTPMSEA